MPYQSIEVYVSPLDLFGLLVSQNHWSSQDIQVLLKLDKPHIFHVNSSMLADY